MLVNINVGTLRAALLARREARQKRVDKDREDMIAREIDFGVMKWSWAKLKYVKARNKTRAEAIALLQSDPDGWGSLWDTPLRKARDNHNRCERHLLAIHHLGNHDWVQVDEELLCCLSKYLTDEPFEESKTWPSPSPAHCSTCATASTFTVA